MKIIIINHYSGSTELGMQYRHFYLAKEFQALGHEVYVIASGYSHLRSDEKELPMGKWMQHGGIPHLWLAGVRYTGNGARRVLNMFGFATDLWWRARRLAREIGPDIVLASSPHPLVAYGAVRLAKAARARFLFEIRDLWPLSLVEIGSVSPRHPFIRLLDAAEAYGCANADKVVSLLPCVAEYMRMRNVEPHRWGVVPNGVFVDDWEPPFAPLLQTLDELLRRQRTAGNSIVGYAGAHGLANSLNTLIDAALILKDQPIAFVLVGSGAEKPQLMERARALGLGNVYFVDPVPKAHIPALLEWFDIAYIGCGRHPLYRFGIAPNKLMDYMMAASPIVHAVEAGNDPVTDANCGIEVPPESPGNIATAIEKILAMSPEARREMGMRGRKFVLETHTFSALAKKMLSLAN